MANFAPYQDQIPERIRSPSPPGRTTTTSPRPDRPTQKPRQNSKNIGTSAVITSPTTPTFQRNTNSFPGYSDEPDRVREGRGDVEEGGVRRAEGGNYGVGRQDLDLFETRLGIRMDWEACLAYLALPPAGGVLLLVLEHKSDYVRFHAWQSSLLFTFLFIIHIIFSWSSFLSWMLFLGDLGLIGLLTFKAYVDAATLDRFEVPFFGPLASSILDDE
ncbi:hypothetical protein EJ08DRAFT_669416 [Tothia fuscella]|uniref:Uncharacterized protein n=1 Tax=Tothia fuscella TaxID=1048955 RepID=A0A9P4TZB8_9PEZI|nr:hypothetical protein EJ08DRAFT_669416 [Tothia fuscella]